MLVCSDGLVHRVVNPFKLTYYTVQWMLGRLGDIYLLSLVGCDYLAYLTRLQLTGDYIRGELGPLWIRHSTYKKLGPAYQECPHRAIACVDAESSHFFSLALVSEEESHAEDSLDIYEDDLLAVLRAASAHFDLPVDLGNGPAQKILKSLRKLRKEAGFTRRESSLYNAEWYVTRFIFSPSEQKELEALLEEVRANEAVLPEESYLRLYREYQARLSPRARQTQTKRVLRLSSPLTNFARFCIFSRDQIFEQFPATEHSFVLFWTVAQRQWQTTPQQERTKRNLVAVRPSHRWADTEELRLFMMDSSDESDAASDEVDRSLSEPAPAREPLVEPLEILEQLEPLERRPSKADVSCESDTTIKEEREDTLRDEEPTSEEEPDLTVQQYYGDAEEWEQAANETVIYRADEDSVVVADETDVAEPVAVLDAGPVSPRTVLADPSSEENDILAIPLAPQDVSPADSEEGSGSDEVPENDADVSHVSDSSDKENAAPFVLKKAVAPVQDKETEGVSSPIREQLEGVIIPVAAESEELVPVLLPHADEKVPVEADLEVVAPGEAVKGETDEVLDLREEVVGVEIANEAKTEETLEDVVIENEDVIEEDAIEEIVSTASATEIPQESVQIAKSVSENEEDSSPETAESDKPASEQDEQEETITADTLLSEDITVKEVPPLSSTMVPLTPLKGPSDMIYGTFGIGSAIADSANTTIDELSMITPVKEPDQVFAYSNDGSSTDYDGMASSPLRRDDSVESTFIPEPLMMNMTGPAGSRAFSAGFPYTHMDGTVTTTAGSPFGTRQIAIDVSSVEGSEVGLSGDENDGFAVESIRSLPVSKKQKRTVSKHRRQASAPSAAEFKVTELLRAADEATSVPEKVHKYEKIIGETLKLFPYLRKQPPPARNFSGWSAASTEAADGKQQQQHRLRKQRSATILGSIDPAMLEKIYKEQTGEELYKGRELLKHHIEQLRRSREAGRFSNRRRSLRDRLNDLLDDRMMDMANSAEFKHKMIHPKDLYVRFVSVRAKTWESISTMEREPYYAAFKRQYYWVIYHPDPEEQGDLVYDVAQTCVEFGEPSLPVVIRSVFDANKETM